ncbi:hypothetical protein [Mycoplasmopsis mustelae]|nr:hypothetical protein [Mycoplasmopsis mustelae]
MKNNYSMINNNYLFRKSDGIEYTNFVLGSYKFILVLSNFSDLFKLSHSRRSNISNDEINNHVNLFETNLKGSIFATPDWIYRQYHVSSMNYNYNNILGNTFISTNRLMLPNDTNYRGWPYKYTVYIKPKKDFQNVNLTYKNLYVILADSTAIYETRSKLET